jgi:hypothetical protein
MQDAFSRASREHGLTPSQAELLCAAMAPAPVNRLAQTLRCDRTNITHLVSRAADHGWVHRVLLERIPEAVAQRTLHDIARRTQLDARYASAWTTRPDDSG